MNPFISCAVFQLSWLDGDIVCLQEVDPFYFPYLVEELDTLGYDGVYKAHDSEHGLATFYKRAKFEMKSSEAFGFTELLEELTDVEPQFRESNKRHQRYAQYTTMNDLKTGKEVVIGLLCIHLKRRERKSLFWFAIKVEMSSELCLLCLNFLFKP